MMDRRTFFQSLGAILGGGALQKILPAAPPKPIPVKRAATLYHAKAGYLGNLISLTIDSPPVQIVDVTTHDADFDFHPIIPITTPPALRMSFHGAPPQWLRDGMLNGTEQAFCIGLKDCRMDMRGYVQSLTVSAEPDLPFRYDVAIVISQLTPR